jgi:hypothetical protein
MASGHTHEVRFKSGTMKTGVSYTQRTEDMDQLKTGKLIRNHKNHTNLSLHYIKAGDINSIVKAGASGADQRHCSTTFYQ